MDKVLQRTVGKSFNRNDLPRWARNDENVVVLCERDLGFRCNVFDAKTAQYKRLLKRQAAAAEARGMG